MCFCDKNTMIYLASALDPICRLPELKILKDVVKLDSIIDRNEI